MEEVVEFIAKLLMAYAAATASPVPTVAPTPLETPTVVEQQSGRASWYEGSRGFYGTLHVALQDGRWTGKIQRHVEVCVGHKCKIVPVVDYCQCYRDTKKERIVDMSIDLVHALELDPSTGVWKDVTIKEIP